MKNYRGSYLLIVLTCLMAILAMQVSADQAAAPDRGTLSLARILTLAAASNPEIVAAWQDYIAAGHRAVEARGLPDPVIMFETMRNYSGMRESMLGLSQKLPFWGKSSVKGRIADRQADKNRIAYEMKVREIAAEIKKLYAELWFYHQAAEIARANKSGVDVLAAMALSEDKADQSALQQLLRAQQQQAQIVNDLLTYKELSLVKQARLNAYLQRDSTIAITPSFLPALPSLSEEDFDDLAALALENRQEIGMARASVEEAKARRKLAHLESRPDVTIRYDVMRMDVSPAMAATTSRKGEGFAVQLNLPIWQKRIRSANRAAKAALTAEQKRLEVVIDHTAADVTELLFALKNAQRLVELYEKNLVPRALVGVSAAEAEANELPRTIADVIEAQSVLYAFQLAQARAKLDRFKLFVDLERVVGAIPLQDEEGHSNE